MKDDTPPASPRTSNHDDIFKTPERDPMKPSVTPESSGGPNIEEELWKQDLLAPPNKVIRKYSGCIFETSHLETEFNTHQDYYPVLFNTAALTTVFLLGLYFLGAFNGSDQSDL